MTNEKNTLDKELIADVVTKAMDNYLKTESNEESVVEDVVDPIESTEVKDDNIEEVVQDDIKETDDVQEEVEEIVEEQILQSGDYNFLGLDINITNDEDGKFNVIIKKDDKEKTSVLDAVNLPSIFGLIEEFFTEIVIDEDTTEEIEETEDNIEEEIEDLAIEESVINNTEEATLLENFIVEEDNEINMSSLRTKYEDKINSIFEHGMLAKELALDMVKDTILAGTVKELIEKAKEKDTLIASKKEDLKDATKNFIVANKYYDSLNQVYSILSSSIREIETDLTAGAYDSKTAKKIMSKYNSILSKVLVAEDVDSLNNVMNTITKTQAIVSSYKTDIANKKKAIVESKTINDNKKEINTTQSVIEKKNVMNSDGWKNNKTLLAKQHRYDSIEEMSAELLKIAGV